MGRFQKKPVVIDAFLFDGRSNTRSRCVPMWFVDAVIEGKVRAHPSHVDISTLGGTMRAVPGDWIIRGVKGELYPCKPDIFEATYEKVED